MYVNEHIVTLSSGDLGVSDHPVVVQMLNFTHVLEIMCRTGFAGELKRKIVVSDKRTHILREPL
jgi:hypothetical protein